MPKQTNVQLSRSRDVPLLLFLWKWKLLSTKAIHCRFFSQCTVARAYNRLRRLRKAGYLRLSVDREGTKAFWSLTAKGFEVVRPILPQLKEAGFGSENMEHDLLCTALRVGEWISGAPENVESISEQQLRRYNTESLPQWIPSSTGHRPDGYWRIQNQNDESVIAIEVELARKTTDWFRHIGKMYSNEPSIKRVVWLIGSNSLARFVHKSFQKIEAANQFKHNFILREPFETHGWKAEIILGPEKGESISKFLANLSGDRSLVESCSNSITHALLDGRRSYAKSITSKLPSNCQNSNAYPISPNLHLKKSNQHSSNTDSSQAESKGSQHVETSHLNIIPPYEFECIKCKSRESCEGPKESNSEKQCNERKKMVGSKKFKNKPECETPEHVYNQRCQRKRMGNILSNDESDPESNHSSKKTAKADQ